MNIRRSPLKRGTKPLKRTPLRKVSTKRAAQLREYAKLRAAYLKDHAVCEVWCRERDVILLLPGVYFDMTPWSYGPVSGKVLISQFGAPCATEIHHKNKRRGAMLNDQTHWLAVCRENHERIEHNKAWARANGFLENF